MNQQAVIISLLHQKGGVGKSTVAVNLAAELSKEFKTLLIDCDPMASSLNFGSARSEALGEENFLTVCQKSFVKPDKTEMTGKAIRQEIKNFKDDYQILIIDSPGRSGIIATAAASVSDLVIVPVIPGFFDIWAIDETLETLDKVMAANEDLMVRILLNRRDDRTVLSKEILKHLQENEMTLFDSTLGNRTIYGHSAAGLSVVEIEKKSDAAREVEALVNEVKKTLNLGE